MREILGIVGLTVLDIITDMQLSPSVDINKVQVAVAAVLFGTSGVAVQQWPRVWRR